MMELIRNSLDTWNRYWGSGFIQYLLAAAGIYLFVRRRQIHQAGILGGYYALGLFFFFFPVTARIIQLCIGKSVYWRFLWILPVIPVTAYAMTHFCESVSAKAGKAVLTLGMVVLIAVCGKLILSPEQYQKVDNRQKVPQTVAAVCELVRQDAGDKEVHLAADNHIATYARVYDPSFYMPYGRVGRGSADKTAKALYYLLNSVNFQGEKLLGYIEHCGCNYLVIPMGDIEAENAWLTEHGYVNLGMVNTYGVYRTNVE